MIHPPVRRFLSRVKRFSIPPLNLRPSLIVDSFWFLRVAGFDPKVPLLVFLLRSFSPVIRPNNVSRGGLAYLLPTCFFQHLFVRLLHTHRSSETSRFSAFSFPVSRLRTHISIFILQMLLYKITSITFMLIFPDVLFRNYYATFYFSLTVSLFNYQ